MRRRDENKSLKTSDADTESPFAEPVVLPSKIPSISIPSLPKIFRASWRNILSNVARPGLKEVRIIHGRGIGVQRNIVRSILQRHPLVLSFQDAPAEAGGWGATVVVLKNRELVSRKGIFTLGFDEVVDGNQDTDGDEAIGEIECRPVKVRPIDIEKINDFAVSDPIDQIANRAAEDKSERRDQARFSVGQTSQHHDHKADGSKENKHEKGEAKAAALPDNIPNAAPVLRI